MTVPTHYGHEISRQSACARPRSDEALPGHGRVIAGERAQMQRVLHVCREIRRRQRRLLQVLPENPPARIFVNVPAWPGHFDIEIDCIAAVADRS